jgi:hypothetical protein
MRKIEVLVFDGCPNAESTVARVHAAIAAANVEASVAVVRVENDQDAVRLRFLGSPTVRVEGVDADPTAAERVDFGLQCRVYSCAGRFEEMPPIEWLTAALVRAP